ncbi:hypothetical protein [Desulfocicer niacini]
MPLISYFDLNCIIPGALSRSGSDSPNNAPGVWSLSFKLNQNVAPLFPYINGEMEDALWYEGYVVYAVSLPIDTRELKGRIF